MMRKPLMLRLKQCPLGIHHVQHDWVFGNFKYLCRGHKKRDS